MLENGLDKCDISRRATRVGDHPTSCARVGDVLRRACFVHCVDGAAAKSTQAITWLAVAKPSFQ